MTGRLIRVTTALTMAAVAAVAAVISYRHAYELVSTHGETGVTARLVPLTVDGLQRANTGFADGDWSVPGGRLDRGEKLLQGAAREALEELGIRVTPGDLTFAHLCHHADLDGRARIGEFFAATRWPGEPVNAEPD